MFMYRRLVNAGLVTCFLLSGVTAALGELCTGPASLETRLHSSPTPQSFDQQAMWFEQHNQPACAVQSYRAALKLDPKSIATLHGLASSLTASGDTAAAIDLLRSAPRNEELDLDLASAYSKSGNLDEAFHVLSRSLRTHPASARLTGALVVVLANHGQLDDAYRLAEKFAQEHPRDPEAQKVHLRVLVATNDASAGPLARRLLAAAPRDGELLYLNGVLEQKAGALAAARRHLEEAISITPNYADSHYNLGLVLLKLQDTPGAAKELEQAVELGASEPEAHLELSKALQTLGQDQRAADELKLYQQAMKGAADRAIAGSKSTDADQAMAKGDAVKAVGLYREAIEVEPQDASLQYKLSLALDRTGDLQGERAALEQSVADDPGLAVAQHQLGYLLYRSGDYDGAIERFRLAVKDDGSFTQAWISLSATLAAQSHFSEAQEAIHHALILEPQNKEALALKKQLATARGPH
jgi:tetratricopeptide (TPR) repeat protein